MKNFHRFDAFLYLIWAEPGVGKIKIDVPKMHIVTEGF